MTTANVFEFVGKDEEGTGVICEDEAQDLYKNRDKLRIYKNTYAKGAKIPRILNSDSSQRKQVFYNGFCLKVFAGELIPEDKGFRERLAVIYMTEGYPKGNIKSLSDEQKLLLSVLRNKILLYKVQNISEKLSQVQAGLEKRDAELWQDFLNVITPSKYFKDALRLVKHYTTQRHQSVWNSLEAGIFKLLMPQLKENTVSLESFWLHLVEYQNVLGGKQLKETWYPNDYHQKVTRYYLSKLFSDKFQARRIEAYEDKKKVTRYQFKEEILGKLAKKYNYTLGNVGQVGKLTDHVDQVDQVRMSEVQS